MNYKRIKSLIQKLYNYFTSYFADKFIIFIKLSLKTLIQHNLFNKRHKMRHEDFKKEKTSFKNMMNSFDTLKKAKMNI